MRLFIAINFDKKIKDEIEKFILEIKPYIYKGKFVNRDYMHLTLEFLGDIKKCKIVDIKSSMDKVDIKPFNLNTSNLGYFKRKDGNIYWLGIEKNNYFLDLQNNLHNLLINNNFKLENRRFTPHITIGRKIIKKKDIDYKDFYKYVKILNINVNSLDLMESRFINNKLVHSIIYKKEFL